MLGRTSSEAPFSRILEQHLHRSLPWLLGDFAGARRQEARPRRRFLNIECDALARRLVLSDCVDHGAGNPSDAPDNDANFGNGRDRIARRGLYPANMLADRNGCLSDLCDKRLHYLGHDRKSLAAVAGECGFNCSVQRKQIGLLRNRGDQLNDAADPLRRDRQTGDALIAQFCFTNLVRHIIQLFDLPPDISDCSRHFVRASARCLAEILLPMMRRPQGRVDAVISRVGKAARARPVMMRTRQCR